VHVFVKKPGFFPETSAPVLSPVKNMLYNFGLLESAFKTGDLGKYF
jgi:hypothetical protein